MSDGGQPQGEGMLDVARDFVRQLVDRGIDLAGLDNILDRSDDGARTEGAEVVSAVPLTDAEHKALETRLRAAHGDELAIRFRIDPAILGGLVVRVGDRYIDGSVAARLGQLRQDLTGTAAR